VTIMGLWLSEGLMGEVKSCAETMVEE